MNELEQGWSEMPNDTALADPMVECSGLVKEYRMGKVHSVRALGGVDLRIATGEFVAIMGPSGSGKSTLLHILGLLDQPDAGSLQIHGEEVARIPNRELPRTRNRKIGFVFQRHHLLPTLTALDNVMLPLRYRRTPRHEARELAASMLEEVGLHDRMRHRPGELSGGQQQRVAIARALVTSPDLVLADEPTGELDSKTSHELMALMRRMNAERHQTFVIVTHDDEVAQACDRTVRMRDGLIEGESAN